MQLTRDAQPLLLLRRMQAPQQQPMLALGALMLVDVDQHAIGSARTPEIVELRPAAQLDPPLPARGQADAEFAFERLAGAVGRQGGADHRPRLARKEQADERAQRQGWAGDLEQLAAALAALQRAGHRVPVPRADIGRVERQQPPGFAGLQALVGALQFHLPAFGHVARHQTGQHHGQTQRPAAQHQHQPPGGVDLAVQELGRNVAQHAPLRLADRRGQRKGLALRQQAPGILGPLAHGERRIVRPRHHHSIRVEHGAAPVGGQAGLFQHGPEQDRIEGDHQNEAPPILAQRRHIERDRAALGEGAGWRDAADHRHARRAVGRQTGQIERRQQTSIGASQIEDPLAGPLGQDDVAPFRVPPRHQKQMFIEMRVVALADAAETGHAQNGRRLAGEDAVDMVGGAVDAHGDLELGGLALLGAGAIAEQQAQQDQRHHRRQADDDETAQARTPPRRGGV